MDSLVLSVRQVITDEEFYHSCQENPEHKFERESDGLILVVPHTGEKRGAFIQN